MYVRIPESVFNKWLKIAREAKRGYEKQDYQKARNENRRLANSVRSYLSNNYLDGSHSPRERLAVMKVLMSHFDLDVTDAKDVADQILDRTSEL